MKNIFVFLLAFQFSINLYAWDWSLKADTQRFSTDNVNLSSSGSAVSDTYSSFGGYIQTRNDQFRIKLKGKSEQYTKQNENDNYLYELSLQYKRNKNTDFTFAVFNQVYNGASLISTDSTSDNRGGRIASTFSSNLDVETSGYLTLNGTFKKYPKMDNRIDKSFGASLGFEHYFFYDLLFNPELSSALNSSSQSYYRNYFYGPSLFISFNPSENLEFFVSGSFTHTIYSGRNIESTVNNKKTSSREYQELKTMEVGTSYTIADLLPIQLKYSINENTSNNSSTAYKAQILSFGVSIKF